LTVSTDYHTALWDQPIPTEEYFRQLFRISKNQIIFGINYFLEHYPLKIGSGRIIWDKVNGDTNFSDGEIAYCSSIGSTRIFPFMWNGMMQGKSVNNGRTMQGNKQLNEIRIHPTQKPVALYSWIIEKFTKKGDSIIDTHLGSGSSAIACHKLGRTITAFEIDETHFNDTKDRINSYLSQLQIQY